MTELVTTLGWFLIDSLWQGSLVALALLLVLSVLRRDQAAARYGAACAALVCFTVTPLLGLDVLSRAVPLPKLEPLVKEVGARQTARVPRPAVSETVALVSQASPVQDILPWLVALWIGGMAGLSLRFVVAYALSLRLRSRCLALPPAAATTSLQRLSRRLGVKTPALFVSGRAKVPLLVGWFKPVILLPFGAATGLTPRELEFVLAHELAHIKRHDYLVNLLQSLTEIVFFYHPAVWWINRVVRQEREPCCDEIAVDSLGGRSAYARTLLKLETLKHASTPALPATGGNLMTRFKRLARDPELAKRQPQKALLSLVLLASLATFALFSRGASQVNTDTANLDAATIERLADEVKEGYPLGSPFEAIRWNFRDETEVLVGGNWYKLVSIDTVEELALVSFARRVYQYNWKQRLAEDLTAVLSQMGYEPEETVRLELLDDNGQNVVFENVALSEANRWAIWRSRKGAITGGRDVANGYLKLAPFTDILWDDNVLPQVTVEGKTYRLQAVNNVSTERIHRFTKARYDQNWQKRVAEDLVGVMALMGDPVGFEVALELLDTATDETVLLEVAMTGDNRNAVRDARKARGD